MNVRVVDAEEEFAALEETWERLHERAAVASVFSGFAWQHLWWRTYGRGAPLRLLVATDGADVVGLLALYGSTERVARVPVRSLRLVGSGGDTSPDDLGPVLAAGREQEVAHALADAIVRLPGWDVLRLDELEPVSPFASTMARAARAAGQRCVSGRCQRISFTDLPDSWEGWLASLHRDRRYRVRKARKDLLAAHPDARFFLWTDPATLDAGIDRLVRLHHARWRDTGQAHGFASPEYVAFHRALMHACFERDQLRLYGLELGGEIVAMYYMYRFRDALYLMQTGFDPVHAKLKPGHVLLGWIIEQAIGERLGVLDFLKGEHRYKEELATGERETVYLTALRNHPAAWVFGLRWLVLPALATPVLRALRRGPREREPTPPPGR